MPERDLIRIKAKIDSVEKDKRMGCLHRWVKDYALAEDEPEDKTCLECHMLLSTQIRDNFWGKSSGITIFDGVLSFSDGERVHLKKDNWPKVREDLERWRKKDGQ